MIAKNYSTQTFEKKYTYTGSDLGAVWTKEYTTFRVWAPTAVSVKLRLYESGTHGTQDLLEQLDMTPDIKGTWILRKPGDLNGVYYTFLVERDGITKEACDPYARTTGVNGRRAMVIDLESTNPAGWDLDRNPHQNRGIVDAVVYELHIRDLSADPASGIRHRGKFLGLTETGTKNPFGQATGLDYIRDLGVTHVQLLPVYDYGSVDETLSEGTQYNWGYDPVNYNVPEGSYSTDPFNGAVRVRELKQTVKTLHDNGLAVVMDVVYNHVYDAGRFCFNRIVPGYFSRVDRYGHYSNGSGCGNDTASERSMVRKYIVDSLCYWAQEYHMDGFRFDLVGLLDVQTIREAMDAVRKVRPGVIFYGEGWTLQTELTKPNVDLMVQANSALVPGFGFFNDSARDTLKGTVFDDEAPGYVSGALDQEPWVRECVMGLNSWCKDPAQSVNYVSCHDNMTLYDRLLLSAPYADDQELIHMNCLAAAIYMLSQGMPLFQAGEELLRSKPLPDGGYDENSYRSPDSVNSIKWGTLRKKEYRRVRDFYRGLIAFRKAHPVLRLTDAKQILESLTPVEGLKPNVTAFRLRGQDEDLFMIFNPNREETLVALPQGDWNVCVRETTAGTEPLATVRGRAEVPAISAMVLERKTEK